MAIKYELIYKDVDDTTYTCRIENEDYTGPTIPVQGFCVIEYPAVKTIYTVVRGSGMQLNLEASTDQTFEDLYSEGEKVWRVSLFRESDIKFLGFIDPTGLFEDLVNDRWTVTLDCVDGLGLLENTSYLKPDGTPYIGKASDIEVIYRCLQRTGLKASNGSPLFLISSINTRYNGLNSALCPLQNTHNNQERFYQEDGITPQSCKEVLESTLRKYGGSIFMEDGLYKAFSFYELLGGDRYFYTYQGATLQSSEITDYPEIAIGSDIDGVDTYWVNKNQAKRIIPGVGAVRVNYTYGFVKSILKNPGFNHDGTVVQDWTILSTSGITLLPNGNSIEVVTSGSETELLISDAFDLSENDNIVITVDFDYELLVAYFLDFRFKVTLTDGTATFYLKGNNEWSTTDQLYKVNQLRLSGQSTNSYEFKPDAIPITGAMQFTLVRSRTYTATNANVDVPFIYNQVSITAATDESIEGETHTQQVSGKNTRIEDVIPVSVGDNPSDIYLGALYKADQDTNTDLWNTIFTPDDIENNQSILEILSEQVSLFRKEQSYRVQGDVAGLVNYFHRYIFDLVPDKVFVIAGYVFNTRTGVVKCSWMELKKSPYFGNSYEYALDYGSSGNPTIKAAEDV